MAERNRLLISPEDDFAYGAGIPRDATWRNLIPAAELGLAIAPGSGEAMAVRDSWNAAGRGSDAIAAGQYGDAAGNYANALLALGGIVPGVGIIARGTKRGTDWMNRNLPEGVNKLLDAAMPSDPKNTMNIFAGPTAKTADHAALSQAQDLAQSGASRDEIWQQTGWFQGVDGKWRFEIDDSRAMLKGQDKGARGRFVGIEHPELEAAYGRLAPVEGSFAPHLQPVGSYMPGKSPHIMAIGRTPEEARSVTLHEFQHGAQDVEGFMAGGNPQQFKSAKDPYDLYRHLAGEVEARNVQARRAMTAAERRAKAPWETQDVPDDQQIVRFR